ncbi:Cht1 chitinase [Candida orthopsilosis Co 90-125]|uniref:chitinase n=1 Tax=Candida orthopsilosis (strain 90-125) TaxID=1136231 RepID=H8WZ64_CANO9|nr:Cht1 chitinase [Candida orthopsilosis Co 90-125]CCG20410.1 Cht1 chitinase [Candida orthopsilosis Co 90-125]
MLFILFILRFTFASNIAAYWGQNAGGSQQSLGNYCSSSPADIIILSFLNNFPTLSLNFANQCSQTFSDGLLHCSQIGQDIKSCQSKGKTILLSLGGATGNYGFSSDSEAKTFAGTLWNKFGGGQDNERPFDDAVVDGFDFDIENKDQTGYPALAKQLQSYFTSSTKKFYLSAAPQCPYPDESVGDLMSQVDLDFAFIQFYNNFCSIDKQFNWDTWSDYASGKNIKLYLGIAGSPSSAGSGYVDLSTVQDTISKIKNDGSFGGVSIWDISSVPDQYIEGINSALEGSASTPTTNSVSDVYSTSGNTLSTSAPSPTAYTPVTSAPASTTPSTTTNAFLNWINGFFSQSSQALQASQAPTSAATEPTTPSLATQAAPTTTNWFGDLFASEVTTYVTITTTVAPSIFKRDIIVDSEATNFHPGYLIVVTFISILFII